MTTIRQLREEIRKQAEGGELEFKAVMGRADGTVKAHGSIVYATLYNGNVIEVYNGRLPRKPFRKIIIGFDESEAPGLLQVLRYDHVYDTPPALTVINHKEQHAWFSFDPVEVYAEQFLPLLPRAKTGMIVHVFGGEYIANAAFHAMLSRDVDMSAEIPATGGAEWVNAEIDEDGVITFNHGANKAARELLLPEDRPQTSSIKKLLFSAKMYAGLINFIQNRLDSDIFDPRFTGVSSGGAATSLDWSDLLNVPTEFNPDLDVTDPLYAGRFLKSADPTVNDDVTLGYQKLDIWINQATNQVFINLDATDGAAAWLPVGSSAGDVIFKVDGALATVEGAAVPYLVTRNMTINKWYIYCENPGTASSTIVDINKGTTIFTTQANRPTLAFDDANGWAASGTPEVTDFVEGDVISIDIDQIATGARTLVIIGVVASAGVASGSFNLTVTDGVTTVPNVGQIEVPKVTDLGSGQVSIGVITSITTVQTRTQGTYSMPTTGDGTVITPLNIVFTPRKAGNKVILEWVVNGEGHYDSVFIVTRNGTKLANTTDASNNRWAGIAAMPYDVDNASTPINAVIKIIDESSLDVASTYSLLVRSSYGTANDFYLNRTVGSAGADEREAMLSVGVATEINA